MKTITLETFSNTLNQELELYKEFKKDYRPIDPFEIFKLLSEGKEIARLVENNHRTKFIQTIRLRKISNNFDSLSMYELLDENDNILDRSAIEDLLRVQFYAKE